MKDLVLYNRMISAISHCSKVDEVKDIRDKALALEHYARQATNVDAERQAINVRVRAERRAGELLKGLQKGKGGQPKKNSVQAGHSSFVEQKQPLKHLNSLLKHPQPSPLYSQIQQDQEHKVLLNNLYKEHLLPLLSGLHKNKLEFLAEIAFYIKPT